MTSPTIGAPPAAGRSRDPLQNLRGAIIWEADAAALRCSFVSESAVALLGHPVEAWLAEPSFFEKHIHPDDWASVLKTLYRAMAQGDVQTCEHRMFKLDGATLWVQTSIHRNQSPHAEGPEEPPRLTGVTVDVTRSKEAEQRLLDADAHARLFIDNLRDYGVLMVSLAGTVTSWNPGARRLAGYAADEIIGAPVSCFFPADEVEKGTPGRLLQQAEFECQAEREGWLVCKGGATVWVSLTLSAVTDERGRLRGFSGVIRDLTRRQQTEQVLRESEEHFRLLVGSVQDYSVFMVSPDGVVQSWNQGAQRLGGYRAHEIIGSSIARFFPSGEVEGHTPERLVQDATVNGCATYEGWLVRNGGGCLWVLLTISAVEDERGRLRGFSCIAKDVTERKAVAEALRESEERLRLLLETVQDYGVLMVSPDGRVASWSPGAERLKGYRAEEIIGMPIARFFPPEEVERGTVERLLQRAAAEGRVEYKGWLVRKTGAAFWANLIFSAVRGQNGQLLGFSNVGRDLTERMRAERAQAFLADVGTVLAESLDYRTTLERIARLATREMAHWCVIEMLSGQTILPVAVAHVDRDKEPLLRDAVRDMPNEQGTASGLASVLQTGHSELIVSDDGLAGEALGIKDPEILRALAAHSYMCVPLTARGKTFGAVAFVAAPGRRYTNDDLRVAEELARRAALAVDNARLYEEAQMASRMREEVLAVVSHDLRNPLSTIEMSAAQLLGQSSGSEQGAITSRIAERIARASSRMNRLIRDLLDFTSIAAGRLRIEGADHDTRALVTEAVEILQPKALEKGVRLEQQMDGPGVQIWCDRERIVQVFGNLIGNALKFTGEGGAITVRSWVERDRVVFSVGDTGAGIPEEDVAHIFDRYWQGKRRSRDSVGLGLAICKGIVQSHGGAIWVESTMGRGTTFFFALPTHA